MPSYLLISLLVQTPGPLCSLHVQTCCISVLNSPFLVPAHNHRHCKAREYFTELLIWLMSIKLSRCICICSGNCCRMFCTAHSLSCASNTCCCKTSRPRSDIGSEALRSIAVMPCVPICQQAAAPHLTDILCLLILGPIACSTLACDQSINADASIGCHSFLLKTLLLGLLCCE